MTPAFVLTLDVASLEEFAKIVNDVSECVFCVTRLSRACLFGVLDVATVGIWNAPWNGLKACNNKFVQRAAVIAVILFGNYIPSREQCHHSV